MRTGLTGKLRLRFAIRFLTVTAARACTTCVARVYRNHADTFAPCFVGHKSSELRESPVGMLGPVFVPNRCPLANVRQFLHHYRPLCVFGFRDKFLADSMIHVTLIAALFAAQLFKSALGRASADALKYVAAALIPVAILLYRFATVGLPIRVSSNVDDAEINTDSVINFLRRRLWNLTDSKQKEIALAMHKVRLALSGFKHFFLTLTTQVRDWLATANRPDVDESLVSTPRQNAIIVSNRAIWLESPLRLFVQLVGVCNLSDTSDYNLSRKAELLSHFRVIGFMDCILPKCLRVPRKFTDSVTSGVRLLKRLLEQFSLFSTRIQLYLRYQFHNRSMADVQVLKQVEIYGGWFGRCGLLLLPALKYRVSALTDERHYG